MNKVLVLQILILFLVKNDYVEGQSENQNDLSTANSRPITKDSNLVSPPSSPNGFLKRRLYSTKTSYKHAKSLFSDFSSSVGIFPWAREEQQVELPKPAAYDNEQEAEILSESRSTSGSAVAEQQPAQGQYFPDKCVPQQLNLVIRHGTRFPSKSDVKRISILVKKMQSLNIVDKYAALKSWINYLTMDKATKLTTGGVQEMVDLATQYVQILPELFANTDSKTKLQLISSDSERTLASAAAFCDGLSQALNIDQKQLLSNISRRNDLLRFFEKCSRYPYEVSIQALQDRVSSSVLLNLMILL